MLLVIIYSICSQLYEFMHLRSEHDMNYSKNRHFEILHLTEQVWQDLSIGAIVGGD